MYEDNLRPNREMKLHGMKLHNMTVGRGAEIEDDDAMI